MLSKLTRARQWAFSQGWMETVNLPLPIFCLGHINLGGSGKTPGVAWLAGKLKSLGHHPAILSRGYGRKSRGVFWVGQAGADSAALAGDEPWLLSQTGIPVVVGEDRAAAAEGAWTQCGADVLVMDDGLQHFRLARDGDVLCLPLPGLCRGLGLRREGWEVLRRVQAVVLTKADLVSEEEARRVVTFLQTQVGGKPLWVVSSVLNFFASNTGEPVSPSFPTGVKVRAVSGLARPEDFEESLRRRGAQVQGCRFPDHHVFTQAELAPLLARAQAEGAVLVTTEKDAMRWPTQVPCVVAKLAWKMESETEVSWTHWLQSVIASKREPHRD